MLNIEKKGDAPTLTLALTGRVDTTTAPELEAVIKQSLGGVTELNIDMAALEYISSAGLRVLLSAQKRMNKQGSLVILNANESLMEIFEVTGFIDILTIR